MKIFLIGGGEISRRETIKIDKEIIKASGGKNASVLFFPTAAGESDGYIKGFSKYYSSLGCAKIESIKLNQESLKEAREKIFRASIIYLGGGSTELLIDVFKKKKIIPALKEFLEKGGILVGMSAGAVALGEVSILSEIEEDLKFGKGFGFLPNFIFLPHYEKKYKGKVFLIKKRFPQKTVFLLPEKTAVYIKGKSKKYFGRVSKK